MNNNNNNGMANYSNLNTFKKYRFGFIFILFMYYFFILLFFYYIL